MTYLLDDLEAHQLVTRSPDPRDPRVRQVLITDTGRTRLAEVRRSLSAAEARLLSDLDAPEPTQLRTLLARFAHPAQRASISPDEADC